MHVSYAVLNSCNNGVSYFKAVNAILERNMSNLYDYIYSNLG